VRAVLKCRLGAVWCTRRAFDVQGSFSRHKRPAYSGQQEHTNLAGGGRQTSKKICQEDLMNRSRIVLAIVTSLLAVLVSTDPSQAQYRRSGGPDNCVYDNSGRKVCPHAAPVRAAATRRPAGRTAHAGVQGTIIGGRPAGCPHRYCGCGLRKYLGIDDKRLNLAWNWAKLFPRVAGPAPGVAAVRSGHVMYIERSAGNGQWLVRDYNSGGGLSRLHVRSVRGYVFVNPRTMLASN
jgi:hypothetical protein